MSMGAHRAEAQPEDGTADTHEDWGVLPAMNGFVDAGDWPVEEPEEHPRRARVLGWVLAALALAWTAAAIWSIAQGAPALTLPNALQWMSFVAPP
jgi:hypothetical protein